MGFWDSIRNWVSNAYNSVKNVATNVWNKVKPFVGAIPLVGNKVVQGVESVAGAIDKGAQGVGNLVGGNVAGAVGNFRDAYNTGKEGVNKLTNLKKGGMVMGHMPKRHRNVFQK